MHDSLGWDLAPLPTAIAPQRSRNLVGTISGQPHFDKEKRPNCQVVDTSARNSRAGEWRDGILNRRSEPSFEHEHPTNQRPQVDQSRPESAGLGEGGCLSSCARFQPTKVLPRHRTKLNAPPLEIAHPSTRRRSLDIGWRAPRVRGRVSSYAGTTTYTYDVHGRLITVAAPSGADQSITTNTYDNAGNRQAVVVTSWKPRRRIRPPISPPRRKRPIKSA